MTDSPATKVLDDADIALLLMDGDQEGLRALLQVHGGRVAGVLSSRFAGTRVVPEDIVLVAALKAWKYAKTFDDREGTLRAWFTRIAINSALDVIAAEHGEPAHQLFSEVDDGFDPADCGGWLRSRGPEADHHPPPEREQRHVALREIVQSLPPSQRVVIEADLAASGVTCDGPELARRLGVSTGSIRVQRHKARETIHRQMIARGLYKEGGSNG